MKKKPPGKRRSENKGPGPKSGLQKKEFSEGPFVEKTKNPAKHLKHLLKRNGAPRSKFENKTTKEKGGIQTTLRKRDTPRAHKGKYFQAQNTRKGTRGGVADFKRNPGAKKKFYTL